MNNVNVDPATLTTIKSFVSSRRTSIQNQLTSSGANTAFSAGATNFVSTSNNLFVISGTAPVSLKTITATINNAPYPVTFTSVKDWKVSLVMSPGTNLVTIQAYDRFGNELTNLRTTNTVVYTGRWSSRKTSCASTRSVTTLSSPMPPTSSSTTTPTRPSAQPWRLEGLDYTFPVGAVMASRSFLVVAKSITAVTSANGAPVQIFGEFSGQLNPQGQTIALVKPGATPLEDTIINRVHYEAAAPWPNGPNGHGTALQVVDPSQDNARVSNWGDGSGWRFFSITGSTGNSSNSLPNNVHIFTTPGGEAYVDDVSLVPLSGPSTGVNILTNGDFEAPLTVAPGWRAPTLPTQG